MIYFLLARNSLPFWNMSVKKMLTALFNPLVSEQNQVFYALFK